MMRILITGANGLLARSLVRHLAGHSEVHASVHDAPAEVVPGVHYIKADLSGQDYVSRLPAGVDVVAHLAQSSKYRQFPDMAPDIFAVNTASTARLLDYAQRCGARQFIYFSTGGLYQPSASEVNESSPLVPLETLNFHFASKLGGEALVNCYANLMNTVIVRPFFIYGQGQRRSMFIPRLVDQIKNGSPIFLDGQEGIRLNPIHVDDAVSFVTELLTANLRGLFNMAGPEVISIKQICTTIGQQLGVQPVYTHRENEPLHLFSSIRKMAVHNCRPQIRIADRIQEIVEP